MVLFSCKTYPKFFSGVLNSFMRRAVNPSPNLVWFVRSSDVGTEEVTFRAVK